MSLFYAYTIGIAAPAGGTPYQSSTNYIVTFTSQEIADKWWRAITDIAQSDMNYRGIIHVTPQLYLYNTSQQNISTTISNGYKVQRFYNQVFFTSFSGPLSVIPHADTTDSVSGKSYFIRSKLNPAIFWWVNPWTEIVMASTTRRTKFVVSYTDGEDSKSNSIMIRSDTIQITLPSGVCSPGGHTAAFVRADGTLTMERNSTTFRFGDFESRFEVREIKEPVSGCCGALIKTGQGEIWELV